MTDPILTMVYGFKRTKKANEQDGKYALTIYYEADQ